MNIKLLTKISIVFPMVLFSWTLPAGAAPARTQPAVLSLAADVLTDSISISGVGIPKSAFREAFGIAIFPNIVKFDLASGNQVDGVVIMRTRQGEWSGPVFVRMSASNAAELTKAGARDVVFIFRTKKLLGDLRTGGRDTGETQPGAEGPGGGRLRAGTDREASAFSTYIRNDTVFRKLQAGESHLSFDADANAKYYGVNGISPDDIFAGNVPGKPLNGNPLTCLMASFTGTTQMCLIS